MSNSNLQELVELIRSRTAILNHDEMDPREELGSIFLKAIRKTMREIHQGADPDDFADITVVNLIILGNNQGYTADEMRVFIAQLKED